MVGGTSGCHCRRDVVAGSDSLAQDVADGALLPAACLLSLSPVRGLGPLPCLCGLCQGPMKDFLTLLGTGIYIPIILLAQPIPVQSCRS